MDFPAFRPSLALLAPPACLNDMALASWEGAPSMMRGGLLLVVFAVMKRSLLGPPKLRNIGLARDP
jgi:hypothetical protein